jgi:ribose 5-phosphate isomerase RpiB
LQKEELLETVLSLGAKMVVEKVACRYVETFLKKKKDVLQEAGKLSVYKLEGSD